MPVSRSSAYEAKRRLLQALVGVVAMVAINVALYRFAQHSVQQELTGVATALSQRVSVALAQSRALADGVHQRWLERLPQAAPCDAEFTKALGNLADRMPYVKGVNVLDGAALVCTSLPGTAQAQVDGMLGQLLAGDDFLGASPLNLGSPGLLAFYPYADGHNVLSVMQAEYFFDLLRAQDPARYRQVVLRIRGTYLRSDLQDGTHLPPFYNAWISVPVPGNAQVYVEAGDTLWWLYIRDSVVTWNVIAIGALWLLFGLSRRFTSQARAFNRALRKAVAGKVIVPYYQPLFDLPAQTLAGVEVLARWPLQDGSFVPPDLFIAQAEANGMITALTRSLIAQVLADLPALALPPGTRVALNLPHEALDDEVLFASVEGWGRILQEHGLQPVIEVTERGFVAISQTERVNAVFGRLRDGGIQIALDDFGAEYSSLGYLHRFHFDYVKIDGLFLDGVGKSREVESVLDGVLGMASSLDLKVVVEKVETPVQLAYLNQRKVSTAQGYYFGRPVSISAWQQQARHCAVCRNACNLSVSACEELQRVNEIALPCAR
ncbi:EAL domain-containing protein [Jeongeupia wiesaeckerbachi]|uniref:EAL domain-containing protein n=1 Tax=Jeongeupia wiesaeckerbachi TaxID=3051218 RepID=UPI003D806571